jgi:outer membrane protein assembly factor BamA
LIYISREDLIEKGKNLITYGENGQIMFYPVINAKIGTASNIGFAYWHSDILLEHDNMFFSPHLYINADWDVTLRYKKKNILGSSFYVGFNTSHGEYGDNSFRDPMKGTYFFADSSIFLSIYSGFNLIGNWGLEFAIANNFYRYDFPNLNDAIIDNDEVSNRGFYRNFESHPLTISMLYNSLDEPYAATRGRKFSFGYSYVPVSAYSGSKDHNYHILESRLVNYTLLGHKSYAMTVAESNANRERLKNLSFSEAIEMFNPINVKEEVLDRRVLVTQVKARYMIEENKGKAPFTAMGRLGGNFPLRAYDDAYFTAPLVAGVSAEYRWPLDRFADMLIFNEYGIYGEDFDRLSVSNIKNSYGFGFRVRTPRFFVTRLALAFHGSQGITVVLTTRPEYD